MIHNASAFYSAPRMQPATTQHRPEDDKNLEQLIDVGVTILSQALNLLNDSLTSDEQLTAHSRYMPGSTIGTMLIPRSQGPYARLVLNACPLTQVNIFVTRETTLLSCLTAWPAHSHTLSHMMYGLETPPWRVAARLHASPLKAR